MKCVKCGKEWPVGVKFCGGCGSPLQQAVVGGRSAAEENTIARVRALLPQIGVNKVLEPTPGVFVIPKGSTHVEVRVVGVGIGQAAIRSTAPVTIGTPIRQDLLEFLLKKNASFMFGGFAVGPKGEILFVHTIMASSVDAAELGASVSAVVNTADKYDEEIVTRWGGKTVQQVSVAVAVQGILGPALGKVVGDALRRSMPHRRAVVPMPPTPTHSPAPQPGAPDVSQAIKVGSVGEEYAFIQRQRCSCGGAYKPDAQAVVEVGSLHYDKLDVSCMQCGSRRSLMFDINAFFGAAG